MLSDAQARSAKPKDKPYKLADGGGLYLHVMPGGSKLWRLKYRNLGKENVLSFGAYPEVSLAKARKARDAAREKLAEGLNPAAER
ncbi:MAG TPA: Arm DNA-binding domain-containing protein, partial [Parvularculaceae bacterium]|nr:Arm DNA-binding domain-containing protein [Parvularculaceae bacterium]